jgi:beta-lactamase class D
MKKIIPVFYCLSLFFVSCNVNKAKVDDKLQKYFEAYGVEGCFTFLNNADGKITVYDLSLDTQRFAPASTFKIVSSLIGLETGVITDEKMVLSWDGVRRIKEWDRSMNMKDAFKVNNVPYFQEVVRRIGADTMQHWLDTMGYGTKLISGPLDSFWFNNSLRISPDEQLGLMKRLYFDQLPFRKGVQESVRNLMIQEDNTAFKLSYKNGFTKDDKGGRVGWLCGWIEENKHVYFFVTLIRSKNESLDFNTIPQSVTRDILKEYGFFAGKM